MSGYRREHGETLERARRAHHLYSARWADMRAQGFKPFVMHRREHPEQWATWRRYFHAHGLFMLMEMLDAKIEQTVPTEWPDEFDPPASSLMERRHADG